MCEQIFGLLFQSNTTKRFQLTNRSVSAMIWHNSLEAGGGTSKKWGRNSHIVFLGQFFSVYFDSIWTNFGWIIYLLFWNTKISKSKEMETMYTKQKIFLSWTKNIITTTSENTLLQVTRGLCLLGYQGIKTCIKQCLQH